MNKGLSSSKKLKKKKNFKDSRFQRFPILKITTFRDSPHLEIPRFKDSRF